MIADSESHLEEQLNKKGLYLLKAIAKYPLVENPAEVKTTVGNEYLPLRGDFHLRKHTHQDFILSFNAPLVMGFIGLLLVIGANFAPFIHLPILGSYSLFLDGRGDGIGVVVLSGIALWLLFIRRYKTMLIPTGISAIIVLVNVIYFVYLKSYKPPETQEAPRSFNNALEARAYELGKELGRNLAETFIQSGHLDWGLGLFIVGFILTFVAASLGIKSNRLKAHA